MLGPAAGAAVVAGGLAAVAVFDPRTTSWYPGCPLHELTGWWCPGCGLTRAAGHVVRGELGAAVAANALWPLVLAGVTLGWLAWTARTRGRPLPGVLRRWRPAWTVALTVVVAAFGVVRNLAPFAALAP